MSGAARCSATLINGRPCACQARPGLTRCGRHLVPVVVPADTGPIPAGKADLIVEALGRGHSVDTALASAGVVARSTFWGWVSRGRGGEEPFAAFVERVAVAQGAGKRAIIDVIIDAARSGDARAAEWLAERLWPADFGPKAVLRRETRDEIVGDVAAAEPAVDEAPAGVVEAPPASLLDQLAAKRKKAVA